jgi:hypothetical protein
MNLNKKIGSIDIHHELELKIFNLNNLKILKKFRIHRSFSCRSDNVFSTPVFMLDFNRRR